MDTKMVDLPHDFGLQLMIIEHLYTLSTFHLIKLSHRKNHILQTQL